jgi:acetyl/propionyl-CoA carboxylase alpha subunit
LQVTQDEVDVQGHAIEVRVYAEDPYSGFLPQSGVIDLIVWPEDARIESAFDGPGDVTTSYDPMVAKIVVHGADREAARLRLIDVLDRTAVFGLVTNLGFARRLVASPEFAAGDVHTSWLDGDEAAALLTPPALPVEAMQVAAGVLVAGEPDPSPFALADGWRSAGPPAPRRVALMDLEGVSHWVEAGAEAPDALWHRHASGAVTVVWQGQPWVLTPPDPMRQGRDHTLAGDAEVTAPMPGTVLSIDVEQGETVTAGQRLGTVEAMKMELALTAPHDGVVTEVEAKTGDQVKLGQHLLTVEASES